MAFSLFYSAAYQSRNFCLFVVRTNFIQTYTKIYTQHIQRVIAFTNCRTFCHSSNQKTVSLHPNISVKEIAGKLDVNASSIIELLKELDHDTNNGVKTLLDLDIAELIADEYGFSVSKKKYDGQQKSSLNFRPPVVTIMGHVDHGKTTLLDKLRNTSIALNEAGGITQSIGAFSVKVPGLNDSVTFVDTPGHAAFNSMRARGAQLTDIVVLVIAADDGVMEQTKECLNHIREASVPFIIAINKIDRPNAKAEKIQRDLLTYGIQLEGYGGDTKYVNISALKGTNIDNLLLLLNNFAKEQKFEASHEEPVKAIVLEVEHNKKRGIVSSVLIKTGKLTKGKILLAGTAMTKVRQILDANGDVINSALPSDPVQILGWRSLPNPGDEAIEMENEAEVRNLLKLMALDSKPVKVVHQPLQRAIGKKGLTQEFKSGRTKRIPYRVELRAQAASGLKVKTDTKRELNVVIKADVSGSLEALLGILSKFHSEHMKLNVINATVGHVTISDLQLAESFNGIVYCFNTEPSNDVFNKAKQLNVSLKSFEVIYKLLDDMKDEIENILPAKMLENIIGEGDVLKVFKLTAGNKGVVAGCRVTNGLFDKSTNNNLWRVMRNNQVIHEGVITSLKHGVTDISIAKQFSECGVILGKFEDFQEGDKLLCVEQEEIKETFEWKL